MINMAKNYIYRMDHDTGFAPNVDYGICSLSGCKKTTIEKWTTEGSWVIGIGGIGTGKPDKIIYVMEVRANLPYNRFKKRYPGKSEYLKRKDAGTNVLVSKKFYYLGDRAIKVPKELGHIIIDRHGCKCVSNEDINTLKRHLSTKYNYGKIGKPNNPEDNKKCGKC